MKAREELNMTKKDRFNIKGAATLKQALDKPITVNGVGLYEDVDTDGKNVVVVALRTIDGTIYSGISASVADYYDNLADIINEDGSVDVKIVSKTSNGGREFFMLEMV